MPDAGRDGAAIPTADAATDVRASVKFSLNDAVVWSSQANGHSREKVGVVVQVVQPMDRPDRKRFAALYRGSSECQGRDHLSYVVLVDGRRAYWPRAAALRPKDARVHDERANALWTSICREDLWNADDRAAFLENFILSKKLMPELVAFARRRRRVWNEPHCAGAAREA
jgi:hypothetical protein